jgi:hypothetical protein
MNIRQEEIDVHYRLTQNQPNFIWIKYLPEFFFKLNIG